MQNALNNDEKVASINSSLVTDAIKRAREGNLEFASQIIDASFAILENVSIIKINTYENIMSIDRRESGA